MIKFVGKSGNVIHIDTGNPDPKNYPPAKDFPEGWKWEELSPEEFKVLRPPQKGARLPDPPHETIRQLTEENHLLKAVLEEKLGLKAGDIQKAIEVKKRTL